MSDGLNIPLNIRSKEAFSKLEKDAKASGAKVGSDLSSGIGGALQVGAGVLGASLLSSAFRGLTGVLSNSISAANRQEDAVNSLNAALKRSGEFTDSLSKDFQAFASELENLSVFGDEVILEQLAFAKSLGLTSQQTKDVTLAAIELSSALGVSLDSAVRNIAKSYSGLKGELGELLPTLRGVTSEQLKSGEATRIILAQFGGAAESKIKTTRGAFAQLSNTLGTLAEKFGAFITQSSLVQGAISSLNNALKDIIKPIDTSEIDRLGADIARLQKLIRIERGRGSSNEIIDPLVAQLEKQKGALQTLVIEQKRSLDQRQAQEIQAQTAITQISAEEQQRRLEAIKVIGLSQSQLLDLQYQENLQKLQLAQEADINQTINFNERRLQLEQQYQEAKAALDTTLPLEEQAIQFEGFTAQLEAGLESLAATSKVTGKDVAKSIQQGIGGGAARGFAAFGAAIVKGENALGAFAEALFQSISQQAVALGTSYVLSGTAMLFSPNPKEQAQAPFLIKSGAALAAFGGALGALSGGGAGVGAGGSNQEIDFAQQQPQQIEQEQRQEPQTAVTVNIQGDVLDSEESSLRIAELLQKAVSDQGVRFV